MSPPSTLETIGRILLAVFLSGIVGLEREAKGRAAGLRTHILVSVGSTLIMLLGLYLYLDLGGRTDPTRLAAQVVSGIGFLGAGTILQSRDSIRGLTTAASLWASAGIGLAVGAGFYLGAVWTTGVVLATLILLSSVERRMGPKGGG